MSTFGLNADQVLASDVLDGGAIATAGTGSNPSGSSWVDRIFSTGTDYVSQFLDYQAQRRLIEEQTKYKLAEQQQQQMLGFAEVPQNVSATVQPLTVPQQSGGVNTNMLLIGGLVLAAVVLLK